MSAEQEESVIAAVTPDLAAILAAMKAAEAEQEFWQEHWEEMLARYPEQFVAVFEGNVIAHGSDLQDLCQRIAEAGLDPPSVWAKHITAKPPHWRL